MVVKFILFLLCIAFANAAVISFSSIPDTDVGVWSESIFVYASEIPQELTTVTIKEVTTNNVEFSTTQLQFDATSQSASFRLKSSVVGVSTISFEVSGAQFSAISNLDYYFQERSVEIDDWPSVYIGYPSTPVKLSIRTPSSSDLSFTPTVEDVTISIHPTPIVIKAGSLSASFIFNGTEPASGAKLVTWTISGTEASLYGDISGYYTFNIVKRSIIVPQFSGKVLIGATTNDLYFYTRQLPNQSLSITPQAADTIFTPSTINLTPSDQVVKFNFNTSTPNSGKIVNFYLGGESKDIYNTIPSVQLVIPKRTIYAEIPTSLVLTEPTLMSIMISAPVVENLTVSFFSSKLVFTPSSVTFTGGKTSESVSVLPENQGSATISFLLSGKDVENNYFEAMEDAVVGVVRGSFFGPNSWYIPTLWVGQESDKIPVRASFTPKTDITLTLSAPDVKFNPPTLTFRNGQLQQFFTITPLYTSNDASYSTITVSFLVSGGDQTYFNPPGPFTITINRRFIQNTWSAHLEGSSVRHLNKEYVVWSTANYIGPSDSVTVTPTSPYFTFTPSVLTFNSASTRVKFTAIPKGIVGSTTINYIIGGTAGGWYSPINSDSVTTAIRPLVINRAVLAPDNRVAGQIFEDPENYEFSSYHTYSFTVYSPVVPDSTLIITPKSAHIQFTPASFSLSPTLGNILINVAEYEIRGVPFYPLNRVVEANFSVTPLASGVHDVWFELSGADAPFYDVPNHFYMNLLTEERPFAEVGSAGHLVPSLFLVLSIFFILF